MASYVSEDLGLQAKITDLLAVKSGLLGASRARQLNVLDTKFVKCLGYPYLGVRIKEGVRKLFSFSECAFNDLTLR